MSHKMIALFYSIILKILFWSQFWIINMDCHLYIFFNYLLFGGTTQLLKNYRDNYSCLFLPGLIYFLPPGF